MEAQLISQPLTPFQLEMVDLLANVKTRREMDEIRRLLTNFFVEANKKEALAFPKLPKDYKVSEETLRLTAGKISDNIDLDKELDQMWEGWAK